MTAAATAVGRGETGQLSVGFYTSLSAGNLRATFVDYAKRFPDLDIRFVQNSRAQILAAFRIRTVDVAVVTGLPRDPNGSGEIMPLWSERVVAACGEPPLGLSASRLLVRFEGRGLLSTRS